ncbi:GmrSD restriction endonuclease domain-containing protein [Psittacicella hinzii]|nr:DUF262 domain-containing protein [Psittacicella hinzii]
MRVSRNYRWSTPLVQAFLNDLSSVIANNFSAHYMGSALVAARPDNDGQEYQVIKGQQRILTAAIVGRVLYHKILVIAQELYKDDLTTDTSRLKYISPAKLGLSKAADLRNLEQLNMLVPHIASRVRFSNADQEEVFYHLETLCDNLGDLAEEDRDFFERNDMVAAYLQTQAYFAKYADHAAAHTATRLADQGEVDQDEIYRRCQFARIKIYLFYFQALQYCLVNTTILHTNRNYNFIADINSKNNKMSVFELFTFQALNSVSDNCLKAIIEDVYRVEELISGGDIDRRAKNPNSVDEEAGYFLDQVITILFKAHGVYAELGYLSFNDRVKVILQLTRMEIQKNLDYFIKKYDLDVQVDASIISPITSEEIALYQPIIQSLDLVEGDESYTEYVRQGSIKAHFRNLDIKSIPLDPELFKPLLQAEITGDGRTLAPLNLEAEMYLIWQMVIPFARAYNLIKFVHRHKTLNTQFYQTYPEITSKIERFKKLNLAAFDDYLLYLTQLLLTQKLNAVEYGQMLDLVYHYSLRHLVAQRSPETFKYLADDLMSWNVVTPGALEFFLVEVLGDRDNLIDDFSYISHLLALSVTDNYITQTFAELFENYKESLSYLQTRITANLTTVLLSKDSVAALNAQPQMLVELKRLTYSFAKVVCQDLVLTEFTELQNLTMDKFSSEFFINIAQKVLDNFDTRPDYDYRLNYAQRRLYRAFKRKNTPNLMSSAEVADSKAQYMEQLVADAFPLQASTSQSFMQAWDKVQKQKELAAQTQIPWELPLPETEQRILKHADLANRSQAVNPLLATSTFSFTRSDRLHTQRPILGRPGASPIKLNELNISTPSLSIDSNLVPEISLTSSKGQLERSSYRNIIRQVANLVDQKYKDNSGVNIIPTPDAITDKALSTQDIINEIKAQREKEAAPTVTIDGKEYTHADFDASAIAKCEKINSSDSIEAATINRNANLDSVQRYNSVGYVGMHVTPVSEADVQEIMQQQENQAGDKGESQGTVVITTSEKKPILTESELDNAKAVQAQVSEEEIDDEAEYRKYIASQGGSVINSTYGYNTLAQLVPHAEKDDKEQIIEPITTTNSKGLLSQLAKVVRNSVSAKVEEPNSAQASATDHAIAQVANKAADLAQSQEAKGANEQSTAKGSTNKDATKASTTKGSEEIIGVSMQTQADGTISLKPQKEAVKDFTNPQELEALEAILFGGDKGEISRPLMNLSNSAYDTNKVVTPPVVNAELAASDELINKDVGALFGIRSPEVVENDTTPEPKYIALPDSSTLVSGVTTDSSLVGRKSTLATDSQIAASKLENANNLVAGAATTEVDPELNAKIARAQQKVDPVVDRSNLARTIEMESMLAGSENQVKERLDFTPTLNMQTPTAAEETTAQTDVAKDSAQSQAKAKNNAKAKDSTADTATDKGSVTDSAAEEAKVSQQAADKNSVKDAVKESAKETTKEATKAAKKEQYVQTITPPHVQAKVKGDPSSLNKLEGKDTFSFAVGKGVRLTGKAEQAPKDTAATAKAAKEAAETTTASKADSKVDNKVASQDAGKNSSQTQAKENSKVEAKEEIKTATQEVSSAETKSASKSATKSQVTTETNAPDKSATAVTETCVRAQPSLGNSAKAQVVTQEEAKDKAQAGAQAGANASKDKVAADVEDLVTEKITSNGEETSTPELEVTLATQEKAGQSAQEVVHGEIKDKVDEQAKMIAAAQAQQEVVASNHVTNVTETHLEKDPTAVASQASKAPAAKADEAKAVSDATKAVADFASTSTNSAKKESTKVATTASADQADAAVSTDIDPAETSVVTEQETVRKSAVAANDASLVEDSTVANTHTIAKVDSNDLANDSSRAEAASSQVSVSHAQDDVKASYPVSTNKVPATQNKEQVITEPKELQNNPTISISDNIDFSEFAKQEDVPVDGKQALPVSKEVEDDLDLGQQTESSVNISTNSTRRPNTRIEVLEDDDEQTAADLFAAIAGSADIKAKQENQQETNAAPASKAAKASQTAKSNTVTNKELVANGNVSYDAEEAENVIDEEVELQELSARNILTNQLHGRFGKKRSDARKDDVVQVGQRSLAGLKAVSRPFAGSDLQAREDEKVLNNSLDNPLGAITQLSLDLDSISDQELKMKHFTAQAPSVPENTRVNVSQALQAQGLDPSKANELASSAPQVGLATNSLATSSSANRQSPFASRLAGVLEEQGQPEAELSLEHLNTPSSSQQGQVTELVLNNLLDDNYDPEAATNNVACVRQGIEPTIAEIVKIQGQNSEVNNLNFNYGANAKPENVTVEHSYDNLREFDIPEGLWLPTEDLEIRYVGTISDANKHLLNQQQAVVRIILQGFCEYLLAQGVEAILDIGDHTINVVEDDTLVMQIQLSQSVPAFVFDPTSRSGLDKCLEGTATYQNVDFPRFNRRLIVSSLPTIARLYKILIVYFGDNPEVYQQMVESIKNLRK